MKKLILSLLALLALLIPASASSHAAYIQNTGWPCPYAGATAPIEQNTFYSCYGSPLTWKIVHISH